MTTYDINFESGLNTLRISAKDEAEARQKAEKRNKYREAFTVSEARIDYSHENEDAESDAIKYGSAYPKL